MRKWGVKLKLYWCSNCNVPIREQTCSRCGATGKELRIGEPGDVRPGFPGDLRMIKEGITNEFGTTKLVKLLDLESGLFFLNKVPHVDDMREVIVGGVVVGRIHFDPDLMCWRWRLSKYSLVLALNEGLVKKFVMDKPKPLEPVGEGGVEGEQAVVVDRSGYPVALAVARKGRFRVQTLFRGEPEEPIKKKTTIDDLIRSNDFWIRTRISKGVKNVAMMHSKTKLPVVVSYSGGKDSLVALHLVLRAGIEPTMLFNDTGLELPETLKNVKEVSEIYGLELINADAGSKFWEAVEVFGPPAKDYRWCCKVVKLVPIARAYKSSFQGGVLSVVGQRAFESIDRSLSGSVWRNRWLPGVLSMSPIQEWDQISVWSYIHVNKLPVNPLYFEGFERLGCYLCPAANIAEYHEIRKKYPGLWCRWEEFLRRWSAERGLGEYYVTKHLWRWHNPEAQGRRRIEKWAGITTTSWISEFVRRSGFEAVLLERRDSEEVSVKITPELPLNSFLSQWRILGYRYSLSSESLEIKSINGILRISSDGIVKAVSSNAFEDVVTAIKLGVRWLKCVGCLSCVSWCPRNAIKIVDRKPYVDSSKCLGCGVCVDVCPITEILVEKNIVTQLLGKPESRGRRRDVITKALSIISSGAMKRIVKEDIPQAEEDLRGFADFLEHINTTHGDSDS
ncbi:MAG: phosphoadenosine phosphosulfate reductase family protein [Desulfurococcaceae archaeon TW002]